MSKRPGSVLHDKEFTGTARLFLVRDLVVFPHVVQALHVREPRHRQLLADALATDSLITLATHVPAPGGASRMSSIVCLARVISHRHHADGTADILVLGLRRAVIKKPVSSGKLYGQAQVELLPEIVTPPRKTKKYCLLLAACARKALSGWPCGELLHKTMLEPFNLSVMTDLLGYWLPLTVGQKLRLLRETRLERRVAVLTAYLQRIPGPAPTRSPSSSGFPPHFSAN